MADDPQTRRNRCTPRAMLALLLLFAVGIPPATADIYRWTDADGAEHYTQDLDAVPALYRDAARARWEASRRRISVTGASPTRSLADEPATGPAARALSDRDAASTRRAATESLDWPGGRSESEWRGDLAAREQAVASAERRIAEIEASSSAPGSGDYSNRARSNKDRARWERGRELRANQRAKAKRLARAHARRARAEQSLEQFRERARRAGVPPGWLRSR